MLRLFSATVAMLLAIHNEVVGRQWAVHPPHLYFGHY